MIVLIAVLVLLIFLSLYIGGLITFHRNGVKLLGVCGATRYVIPDTGTVDASTVTTNENGLTTTYVTTRLVQTTYTVGTTSYTVTTFASNSTGYVITQTTSTPGLEVSLTVVICTFAP